MRVESYPLLHAGVLRWLPLFKTTSKNPYLLPNQNRWNSIPGPKKDNSLWQTLPGGFNVTRETTKIIFSTTFWWCFGLLECFVIFPNIFMYRYLSYLGFYLLHKMNTNMLKMWIKLVQAYLLCWYPPPWCPMWEGGGILAPYWFPTPCLHGKIINFLSIIKHVKVYLKYRKIRI